MLAKSLQVADILVTNGEHNATMLAADKVDEAVETTVPTPVLVIDIPGTTLDKLLEARNYVALHALTACRANL